MFSFYSTLNDVYFAVWVSPVVQSSDFTHPTLSYASIKALTHQLNYRLLATHPVDL